jgi:tripartite-type tricarboxylate transporter receptor subunit TctC
VQLYFAPMLATIEYIRAGTLRALAVTTRERSGALPGIPAVDEFVPGYEASQWYGIGAPRGTSAEIVNKLNRAANAGLADPKMKARFADTALRRSWVHPPNSADLSPRKPRSGARWSNSPARLAAKGCNAMS